jgi:hypothetical protein
MQCTGGNGACLLQQEHRPSDTIVAANGGLHLAHRIVDDAKDKEELFSTAPYKTRPRLPVSRRAHPVRLQY